MLSETTLDLAVKFRQNWQTQYPYLSIEKPEGRNFHLNQLNRNHMNMSGFFNHTANADLEDDSLTNLNWLQNLNLFSLSQSQPPLSPSPTHHQITSTPQFPLSLNPMNQLNRIIPQYFESSGLYAEVALNLEFMNDEASVHFFKMNNQLRPPFSDINLISMAIHSYNKMKVSFPEIYQWIEETFPYYKSLSDDWKTGIKNHLTLSKCFQKVPRRKDESEKGGFWRFSNDFLNYLERIRMQKATNNKFEDKIDKSRDSSVPEALCNYKFGKIINRKRSISSVMSQDENRNSAFKIPKKKFFFNQLIDFPNNHQLSGTDQTISLENSDLKNCKPSESVLIQFRNDSRQSLCAMNQIRLATTSNNESQIDMNMSVLSTATNHQMQGAGNIFTQNLLAAEMNSVVNDTNSPCPEQLTEEEFLSGQAFNNNYLSLTTQSDIPSLLDTQNNFHSNDFNINDLSITGIGLKPPEWWNQSLSASQISLSKFNCSFRSVAAPGNGERGSPFGVGIEEDHPAIWSSDLSNLAELDVLFGLS